MGLKRRLLYMGYSVLKKTGYMRFLNSANQANILAFHRVNGLDEDPLTTRTETFEDMMREISRNYRACSLQDLIKKIKHGETLEPRTVVITFDDGYKDNFENAAPILRKYDIPATFFVTSNYINTDRIFPWDEKNSVRHPLMTWDDVRELVQMGFEIGGHTANHVNLGTVSLELARQEIFGCKERIEKEIGREITAFAVPFGRKDCIRDGVAGIVKEAGFDCCCLVYGGKVTAGSDLHNLYRIPVYPNTIELTMELDNFMTYFDGRMKINLSGISLVIANLWDPAIISQITGMAVL